MADNLSVTAGSGSTIGMDEVVDGTLGTVKVGFGKIMDGTLDGTDKLKISAQNAAQVAGDAAHDAADAGNPIKVGGKARSSAPADVTANDRVDAYFDLKGRLKTDGSDVTQPVSLTSTTITGTVAVTQSGTWDEVGINDSGNSITVDNPQLSIVGGGTEAAAMRVTLASDSTGLVSVDDNGGSLTVDGTVAVTGVSTLAEQQTQTTALQLIDDIVYTDDTSTHATGTSKGALIMGAATPTDAAVNANDIGAIGMTNSRAMYVAVQDALPAGTNNIGDVDVLTLPALPAGTNNIGDVDILSIAAGDNNIGNVDIVTMPNVTLAAGTNTNEVVGDVAEDIPLAGNPVRTGGRASAAEPTAMSADNDIVTPWHDRRGRLIVTEQAGTGTQTSVPSSATNVTLLAANTSRRGAILVNDSTQICYVRLQATATSSNFSYKMQPDATIEIPFGYTGIIDGIWASANGNMRVTEIT